MADEGAEVVGPLGHAELGLQVRPLDGRPDARRQRRQLGRVEHLEPGVVVQQRLELGQLVVGLGPHHRRHQVVDDRGVGAPLGLHALAGVVDHERVDERDVAQRRVGRAPGREREHLARQPLERPVLAQVDERVGAPHAVQPPVAREVVVGGRKLGVVVDPDRVVAVAARRLDGQDHVAQRQPRDHEVVAVHVLVARRRAPALLHRRAQRLRQLRVPGPVLRDRQPQRRLRELRVGEELGVVAAGLDQRVHERVAVGERALHLHAVGVQRVEQLERAGRRVQPHRHAHLGVLGGEARQHDGHASVGRRQRAQPRRAHGQPGHARAALGVGDVARHGHADGRVVRVALLERDDARQQAPVELGDRDLRGRVERGQAGRAGLPRRARARRAHRLQHRHVEGDERAGVPLVGGARAAGGEHGRQQRVDVAVEQRQGGHVAVAVAPQRVAPDRERIAARGLDGRAQRVDEVGVAGQAVRAVEADADRRPAGIVALEHALERHVARAGQVDAEVGDLVRRLEPVALEQERVGEEAQELLDVVDVAVTQVLARLGHGAGRRGRERGHLGVGLGLAAQGEQGDAGGRAALLQQVEAVRPSAPPAEHPAQHHAGAVEDVVHERLVLLHAARVGAAHLREVVGQAPHRRRRGEDLGVGGGDEAEHAGTSVAACRTGRPVGGPEAISACSRSVSRWSATRSPRTSRRASRAAANGVVPGAKRRPRCSATQPSRARRNASCSSAPCHDVPSTAPTRQPSSSKSGSPPVRATRPWRIS